MAKFRIVQKPSIVDPRRAVYEVQEKELLWWCYRNVFNDVKEAEQWIVNTLESLDKPFVKTCVVSEYKS